MTWNEIGAALGQSVAATSVPVVLANDQVTDSVVIGQAGQSALGNNVLLAAAGNVAVDTLAGPSCFRAAFVHLIGTAGITAGAVIFEGSNDGVNWIALPWYSDSAAAPVWSVSTIPVPASTAYGLFVKFSTRYIRCRISTAFVGGTVQAVTRYLLQEPAPRSVGITGGVTTVPTAETTDSYVTTASTNARLISASSSRTIMNIAISNPTATAAFVKYYGLAAAPTVGTSIPFLIIPAPANSFQSVPVGPLGIRVPASGLAMAVSGAQAVADATAAVAGVIVATSYV